MTVLAHPAMPFDTITFNLHQYYINTAPHINIILPLSNIVRLLQILLVAKTPFAQRIVLGQVLIQVVLVLMLIQVAMNPFAQRIVLGQIWIQIVLNLISIRIV